MKKKVLIGLTLMLMCFLVGGMYIVRSIESVTQKLEDTNAFHKVEFLRKNLEHQIKSVQADLLLQGSPHSKGFDATVTLAEAMEKAARTCLDCHHERGVAQKLDTLQLNVDRYLKLLSRTLTIRANSKRLENARSQAFAEGDKLLSEVMALSVASADKISQRIKMVNMDITATKHLLITCIVLGPIAVLIVAAFFLKRFTGSVDTLVTAAHTLEQGDMNYRIDAEPLKDEFQVLANAFNGMTSALQMEQKRFASVFKMYQALFENAGDAIMITGVENENSGIIISANQAAADMFGYAMDELVGMNIVALIPDGKAKQFQSRVREILEKGWKRQRVRRQKKDGTQIQVDVSMGLLPMEDENYTLSFCRDITEAMKAEEELQRANQLALCGQMAAGLAHEIKNPLAGIKVSLDVLADDLELQPDDKDLFARVINEINRMEKLLKNLLNFARPPQPQFDLVDINQLIENTLKNVQVTAPVLNGHKITFLSELSENLPRIEADSGQLQQIFLNLLLNAIDAIDTEGTITVESAIEGTDHIRIVISDTGKGMSETSLEKIFSPFFTTKTKGNGLGLSICKRLIEQHQGTIEVTSQPDQGTRFVITLPLLQNSPEA